MAESCEIRAEASDGTSSRKLVSKLFRDGVGRHDAGKPATLGWSTPSFRAALRTAWETMGKPANVKIPKDDTIRNWSEGETAVEHQSRDLILRVFFGPPPWEQPPPHMQELTDAWERERQQSRRRVLPEVIPEVRPQWMRYNESVTEELAQLWMDEPKSHSDDGDSFRLEGEPEVTVREQEINGRRLRIGVRSVDLAFESNSYVIRKETLISTRSGDSSVTSIPGVGVRFIAKGGWHEGPLWINDYFAVVDSRRNGNGELHLFLRATRGGFKVIEVDERGRQLAIRQTTEQQKILDIVLGKDSEAVGRVILAKVTMKRK